MYKKFLQNKNLVNYIFIFLVSLFFGVLAHGFAFFNPSLANDGLQLDLLMDENWQISIGRFLQPLVRYFTTSYYNPVLAGFLWILFLSIAFFFIQKIYGINNKLFIGVFCALIITSCSFLEVFGACDNWNYIFAFAFMLSCVAVYLFFNKKFGWLYCGILTFIVLAIYQSYICAIIALFVMVAIKKLLNGETIKDTFFILLKAAVSVIVAVICYYIAFKLMIKIKGVKESTGSYNSPSQIEFLGLKRYMGLLFKAYIVFATTLTLTNNDVLRLNHGGELVLIVFLCFIVLVTIILLLKLLKAKEITLKNLIALFGLLVIFPIVACSIIFLNNGMAGHRLYFASFIIFVFPILVYERYKKANIVSEKISTVITNKLIIALTCVIFVMQVAMFIVIKRFFYGRIFNKFLYETLLLYLIPVFLYFKKKEGHKDLLKWFTKAMVTILASLCIVNNIAFTNETHMKNHLRYERTYYEMSNLVLLLENTEGFTGEEDFVFIGGIEDAKGKDYSVTYDGSYSYFFQFILGKDYKYATYSSNDLKDLLNQEQLSQVNEMPTYSNENCIKVFEDLNLVVIKFKDIQI